MTDINEEWRALVESLDTPPEYYVLRLRKDDVLIWAMYLLGVLVGLSVARRN